MPAYAGMILAEQGCQVTKWFSPKDPILELIQGEELWQWLNHKKHLTSIDAQTVLSDPYMRSQEFGIIIDNFRPATLNKWEINPQRVAKDLGVVWVSMRDELGDRSFDLIAQSRSWLEYAPWMPCYVGDTIAGLWLAFKALAVKEPGHYCLGQASVLQKLVEGELILDIPRHPRNLPETEAKQHPLDPVAYWFDGQNETTVIDYRGSIYREPIRDRQWKLQHLWHQEGRIII